MGLKKKKKKRRRRNWVEKKVVFLGSKEEQRDARVKKGS